MAAQNSKEKQAVFLVTVGLLSWFIPGGGYYLINEKKRAAIVFVTIVATFCIGLYAGSIGVVDPLNGLWSWYTAQIMASPLVAIIGHLTIGGGYPVYGRPNEMGQIYTGIAGLLNLLCIVNCVYMAHLKNTEEADTI